MDTLNGTHPLLDVSKQFLNNGDVIVFHYTDDYTKEEGSDKWGVPGAVEEVKDGTKAERSILSVRRIILLSILGSFCELRGLSVRFRAVFRAVRGSYSISKAL